MILHSTTRLHFPVSEDDWLCCGKSDAKKKKSPMCTLNCQILTNRSVGEEPITIKCVKKGE